jgi:hypothetical protein
LVLFSKHFNTIRLSVRNLEGSWKSKEKTSQTPLPFEIFYLSLAPPLGALENCNLCHKMTISKSKSTCPRTLSQINDTKNLIPNFTFALYNKNLGETFSRCVMKIYEFESKYESNAD